MGNEPEIVELGGLCEYDDARSIDLHEARKLVRGRGGPVAVEVLRRWCHKGMRPRPDGGRLLFPAVKLCNEWRTMPEWVAAFETRRLEMGLARPRPTPLPARPARLREAAHRRAEEFLEKAGVK